MSNLGDRSRYATRCGVVARGGSRTRIQGKDWVQGVDKMLFELLSKDQTDWGAMEYIYVIL